MDAILQPAACKYIRRWQHRLKLVFRAWPKFKETHKAVVSMKEIPVNGIRISDEGAAEVWHMTSAGVCGQIFEIGDDDFDVLTAIPKAGAKVIGKMRVLMPGTADERVRKECWLHVDALANKDSSEKRITMWGRNWTSDSPKEIYGETPEDALGKAGVAPGKVVFFERDADIDEDLILREVLENDAMIVLNHRPDPARKSGVTARAGQRLMAKANFWTIPGRDPCDEGGALNGYQFADRIVRWSRRLDEENREKETKARISMMHESTREKGRASRRRYFLENVVTRFAERVGISRQRVMARFLDEGVVDWLVRSVDAIKPIRYRETSSLLRGRISDAVNALEFYYRAVESMDGGGGQ